MRIVGLFLIACLAALASAQRITVRVDQRAVRFDDQQPIERRGRVYVPLRGVFEHMGAIVRYDEAAKVVRVTKGEKEIEVPIGKDFAVSSGNVVDNGGRAIIVNGRAMVPLRFLAENLDAKVDWIGEERCVEINTMQSVNPRSGTTGGTGGGRR